uniref:Uncharacterized protein n=1 Tax=Cucumis melo TaxID=3656 RepID=A0A9I9CBT2_CUCME
VSASGYCFVLFGGRWYRRLETRSAVGRVRSDGFGSDLMVSAGDTFGSDGSATAGDRLHGGSSDAGGRRLECEASTDVVVGSGSTGFHGGRLARAKGKQAQLRVRGDLKGDWVSRRRASEGLRRRRR